MWPWAGQVAAAACFWIVVLIAGLVLVSTGWPEHFGGAGAADRKRRWENASRFMASCHGSLCFCLAVAGMHAEYGKYGKLVYDAPNSAALAPAMLCSMSYFVADVFYLLFDYSTQGKPQLQYFVHHAVCIGYISVCQTAGIGAQTVCAALMMAETTAPCQNAWYFSKEIKRMEVHATMSHIYTISYLAVRCVLAPLWSAHIIYFMVSMPNKFGGAVMPMATCIVVINAGGIWWSRSLIAGYRKFLNKQRQASKE